jgi:thiamine pyrophosphate-dependent acetolactate synthase large subunit-like protein
MMNAERAVAAIAAARERELVVTTMTGLGCWPDAPSARDFRLLGLMGAAASIGLGLAIGRPEDRVWVLDGDGSLLMQLGVLAAIADAAPDNFVHIVIANRMYAISGGQPLPAGATFDWVACARAAGYRAAACADSPGELTALLGAHAPGPRLVVARCRPVRPDYPAGAFAVDASQDGARLRAALATEAVA